MWFIQHLYRKYNQIDSRQTRQKAQYLKADDPVQVSDGPSNEFKHVQESVLQELLYRHTFSLSVLDTELGRKSVSSPKQRPVDMVSIVQSRHELTHAIVAAANLVYPQGQMPRSASTCPPPFTPTSHAASVSCNASRSKPATSSVHAGAPEPPEYRDHTSWCKDTKAVIPY